MPWVEIILIELICGVGVGFIELVISVCECGYWITPNELHRHWKNINWFGCYVSFILLSIVSPLMFLVKVIIWLFTVGRNSKEEEDL